MPIIKISDIKISHRQRRDVPEDHIRSLASSIGEYGLLNAITLDRNHNLVAGFCRTMAHLLLGRDEIRFEYIDEQDEVRKKEIELDENLRRKQLEPWEEAQAIAELHGLRQARDPEWTQEMTAQIVGKRKSTVSNAVQIAKAMASDMVLAESIKASDTLVGAIHKVNRAKELKRRRLEIEARLAGHVPTLQAEILEGDAAQLIKRLPDESVDLVLTNPPFGVDLDFGEGAGSIYHDEETYVTDLVRGLAPEWYRILRDGSWLVSFFDVRKLTYNPYQAKVWAKTQLSEIHGWTREDYDNLHRSMGMAHWLEQAGFVVNLLPMIWAKPNKTTGVIRDPNRHMVVAYEAMLLARKGDAVLLQQGRQNIFIHDTPDSDERVHPLQMPTPLCYDLIRMTTPSGATVHDSFAGSGAIGLGALQHRCNFIGFELSHEKAENGNLRLREALAEIQPEEAA